MCYLHSRDVKRSTAILPEGDRYCRRRRWLYRHAPGCVVRSRRQDDASDRARCSRGGPTATRSIKYYGVVGAAHCTGGIHSRSPIPQSPSYHSYDIHKNDLITLWQRPITRYHKICCTVLK